MTGLTFLVLGLAAYRATRAVAIDSITQPMREWAERRTSEPGHWFDALVHCGFCSGFWLAGITYLVWALVNNIDLPVLEHLINWWAVAGLQALFIAIDTFFLREAPPH